jgi:hypothetical protein
MSAVGRSAASEPELEGIDMGLFSRQQTMGRMIETSDSMTRGAEATHGMAGGLFTALASAVALLFSAYSVYETSLRRPELHIFVPPVIQYSSPYQNSNFEVFNIPVTFANVGARSGTVLSVELVVTNERSKETKRFYAADLGRWTMDAARAFAFQPYAPTSMAGKSSTSQNILFYPRDEEKVMQIADQQGGTYRFVLNIDTAWPEDLGFIDQMWSAKPKPLEFVMTMDEIDHRTFNVTTQRLHSKDWTAAKSGP